MAGWQWHEDLSDQEQPLAPLRAWGFPWETHLPLPRAQQGAIPPATPALVQSPAVISSHHQPTTHPNLPWLFGVVSLPKESILLKHNATQLPCAQKWMRSVENKQRMGLTLSYVGITARQAFGLFSSAKRRNQETILQALFYRSSWREK